jgi:hypothetical protein
MYHLVGLGSWIHQPSSGLRVFRGQNVEGSECSRGGLRETMPHQSKHYSLSCWSKSTSSSANMAQPKQNGIGRQIVIYPIVELGGCILCQDTITKFDYILLPTKYITFLTVACCITDASGCAKQENFMAVTTILSWSTRCVGRFQVRHTLQIAK